MNDSIRRARMIVAVIGLVAMIASVLLGIVFPGQWWTWSLVIVAVVCLVYIRRTNDAV
jgi:fatty acid desaturase